MSVLLAIFLLLLSGCATKTAVQSAYDFSKIHRVAVLPFQGTGGAEVAHEFIRQLVADGLEVTDRSKNADAVLSGMVTDYKADNKSTIFLGTLTMGQTAGVTNPVFSSSGSQATSEGLVIGPQNPQIVSVNASVGVVARLIDPPTGNVIWADATSYEGLDIAGTLQAVTTHLVQSLQRVVPRLNRMAS